MYEIRVIFYHGGAATKFLSAAIESLQFIMNFETIYVSLAQVVETED